MIETSLKIFGPDKSILQLLDDSNTCFFQSVFHDNKSQKLQLTFYLISRQFAQFWDLGILRIQNFTGQCNDSDLLLDET